MTTIDVAPNRTPVPAGQVPAPSEQHSILVRQAFTAIDTATTVDEVKSVLEQWTGLAAYARAAKNTDLEADAAEIKMRAERRLGEMMQAQKETVGFHKGGRPQETGSARDPVSEKPGTLGEAGIDKHLADRARKEAAKPKEQFEENVAKKKHDVLKGKGNTKTVKGKGGGKGKNEGKGKKSEGEKPSQDIADVCIELVRQGIEGTAREIANHHDKGLARRKLERLFAALSDVVEDRQNKWLPADDVDADTSAAKRKALNAAMEAQ
jgi:hypothetical protein